MRDTKKKGTTRCAVDIPAPFNARIERLLADKRVTGRIPKNKRALVLECARIGFEQLIDEAHAK